MLVLTNNLDNRLISRTNYLIRFLIEKRLQVKILDFSFYKNDEGIISYLKNVLSFPSKVLSSNNAIVHFPSLPLKSNVSSNYASFIHFFHSAFSIILSSIITRSLNYDVIVSTDPISALVAVFVKKPNAFFVYEDLDYFEDLQTGKVQRKFVSFSERLGLKQANLVVSVSEPLAKRASKLNSDCIVVPNGADLDCFQESIRSQREPFIIYAGSLDEWAGLRFVIEAFPKLRLRIPWINMKIAGAGKERTALQELVKSLLLEDTILFIGKLPYDQLALLLSRSSIGVAMFKPGNAAAFASPLKLFDYMAAGMPIVATDIGDIGRIIKESKSGFAIRWNPDDFIEALAKILTKEELWQLCHTNGLCYVKQYDWTHLFEGWLREIQNRLQLSTKFHKHRARIIPV
jgi:glycosyltransferase involved in cell wall biosynthesis